MQTAKKRKPSQYTKGHPAPAEYDGEEMQKAYHTRKKVYMDPKISRIVQTKLNASREKKFILTSRVGDSISYSGTIYALTNVAQGTTDSDRVGDRIYIKSVQVRWNMKIADVYNQCRVILFQWDQDNSGLTMQRLLAGTLVGTNNAPLAPYAHDFSKDRRILYDKSFILDGVDKVAETDTTYVTRGFMDRRIQYYSGSSTTGNGFLFLAVISDSSAINHPTLDFVAKVTYTDA